MPEIAKITAYEEPRKADNIQVYVPPPTFWESSAKILGAPFQAPSSDSTSSISTYAQAPSSREETKEQVNLYLGGLLVGVTLGVLIFKWICPKGKSRSSGEMAKRWLAWGLLVSISTGMSYLFRRGGADGVAGGLLGVVVYSVLAWILGFLFGLIKFSLFPKIFIKSPAFNPLKPAEIPALREAAGRGDSSARYQLGMTYFAGEGVVKNHIEAYKWILLAQAGGHADAKRMSAQIEKTLSRQELAEGQKLATEIQGNT
jgi:hypothetical protein